MNKKVIAVVIIVALIAGVVVLYLVKPEFLTGSVLGKKTQVEKTLVKKGAKKVEKAVKKKAVKKVIKNKAKAGIKGKTVPTTDGSVNSGTEADPVLDTVTPAPDLISTPSI